MTRAESRFDAALEGQHVLQSVTFGDTLDWTSPLMPVDLLVELSFWLLIDGCELDLPLGPAQTTVRVHDKHREVYAGEVRDSRATLVYRGPRPELMHPDIKRLAAEQDDPVLAERPSRTVLRLACAAHSDVFSAVSDSDEPDALPRRKVEGRPTSPRCARRTSRSSTT